MVEYPCKMSLVVFHYGNLFLLLKRGVFCCWIISFSKLARIANTYILVFIDTKVTVFATVVVRCFRIAKIFTQVRSLCIQCLSPQSISRKKKMFLNKLKTTRNHYCNCTYKLVLVNCVWISYSHTEVWALYQFLMVKDFFN